MYITITIHTYDADIRCHVKDCLWSGVCKGRYSPKFHKYVVEYAQKHLKEDHGIVLLPNEWQLLDYRKPDNERP